MPATDVILFESLAIEDGQILNLEWHEKRYHKSYLKAFGVEPSTNLLDGLDITIPAKGLYKLRVDYGISKKTHDIKSYTRTPIKSLRVIEHNTISYDMKYADRDTLNELFQQKENCQDVLIIKNDLVTDTTIGNIVFFDGKQWFTPRQPLLHGTQRAQLISNKTITEKDIHSSDIKHYKSFLVINAMRPFSADEQQAISGIVTK